MDDWKTIVSFSDGLLAAAMFQGVYRSVPVFSLIAMILLVLEWLHSWDSLVLHIFLAELEQHRHELSMKLTWKKNKTEVVCYNCQVFWVEVPSWDTCDTHGERERELLKKKENHVTHWDPIVHFDHKSSFSETYSRRKSFSPIVPTSLAKSLTSFCKRPFSTSWQTRLPKVQGTIRRSGHLLFKFVDFWQEAAWCDAALILFV